MARSASTPRLRLTLTYFLALVPAAGLFGAEVDAAGWGPLALLLMAAVPLLLVVAACLGRIWCSVFIAGRKDATIVDQGPYAMCRHPLYTLSLVGGLGLGLATRSLTLTLLTLAVLGILFRRAAIAEERFLLSVHGDAYARYMQSTPRWMPRWSAWSMPAEVRVIPRVLWKAFVDAGAFFLLYVLIEVARLLQLTGVLPMLLRVP